MTTPLPLDAWVDDREIPIIQAVAEQLSAHLGAAAGTGWPIGLRVSAHRAAVQSLPTGPLITSLLGDALAPDVPLALVEQRWRQRLTALAEAGCSLIFICTVFAHMAERDTATIERIRRLNVLAAELSHDSGAYVIDINRVFALIGGSRLETDFRLTGRIAREAAAHVIVQSLLEAALDDFIPFETQEQAKRHHGGLPGINAQVNRRLNG